MPNPADASVPDGGEDDGEVLRIVGDTGDAPPLDHATYAEAMGWVDADKAVEMSGSRFAYVMREAVLLELALLQWVMGVLVRDGFAPVAPPVLVREHTMEEAGFFPTDRSQVYDVDNGELFLVGTSEVPLSALHRGDILDADALPLRYAACRRTFAAKQGRTARTPAASSACTSSTRWRCSCTRDPDLSWEEHERILAIEEEIYGGLGLPYRVVNIAAGDLGPAAAKKFDIEAWLPSEGRYRELTSCSNYLDYSARRLGTRVPRRERHTSWCTRSTAPRARSRARWCSSSNTASSPTVRSSCPSVLQPFTGWPRGHRTAHLRSTPAAEPVPLA